MASRLVERNAKQYEMEVTNIGQQQPLPLLQPLPKMSYGTSPLKRR
jgi:hypothetical protein